MSNDKAFEREWDCGNDSYLEFPERGADLELWCRHYFAAGYAAAIKDAVEVVDKHDCDSERCKCLHTIAAAIERLLE